MLAHPAKPWLIDTDLNAADRYGTKMSSRNHSVALAESQHHVIDPTNPRRALDDGVENRLHVRRRAADDAEHLGRCRLMLQGLAQFRVALLNSLNSRTFSMAMTAWSAKVSRSAICLSVKGWTSVARIENSPDRDPFAKQRAPEQCGTRSEPQSGLKIRQSLDVKCHGSVPLKNARPPYYSAR